MHRVYKYPLEGPETTLQLPVGAKFLSLHLQHGVATTWFLVDPEAPTEQKTILAFGTGHDIPNAASLQFLGTIVLDKFSLVFHIFTPHNTPQA